MKNQIVFFFVTICVAYHMNVKGSNEAQNKHILITHKVELESIIV